MRALITENSRLYRQLLENILGQQGFETDICDNIKDAKEYLQGEFYHLICINQLLLDGSGIELVEICKQSSQNQNTPILFLTSDHKNDVQLAKLNLDEIVYKQNLQQIADQITHFVEIKLDPLFFEGRILLVEDSKSIAAVILAGLEQTGYRVDHFLSAEKAWDEFRYEVSYGSDAQAFDLVITDINLEGKMDGHQLIGKIRSLDDARGFVPVISITSNDSQQLRLSLYQTGVNDFLQKPILLEELIVRVGNLMTNKRLLDKVHDQRRELFSLATTDPLTGCHNRHSLTEFSSKFIAQAMRHKYPVSLMVIDLDHFKLVNDNHGHAVGDIVLAETGKILNTFFREGDMAARFGGEEFVILLNHCDAEFAMKKAEKLRQKIEQLKPNDLTITSSIGVTTLIEGQKCSFDQMFSTADHGVYAAKEGGRNQVVFEEMEIEA